ncbi:MAG: endoglucanase [Clostridia bacterium]|nr:endoglucanase [Clostridia bacterium]
MEGIPILHIPYVYRHLPIGGGGYVTGFVFHPTDPDVMYCRTDIGGAYRFDYAAQRWVSLVDHVSHDDLRETCPISVALDPQNPARLYIASGLRAPGSKGCLTVSDDYGATFRKHELPFFVHGNLHGRGTGERLLAEGDVLWMASQLDGLWRSPDGGVTWQRVESFPETACTFISRVGNWLLVGTEGLRCRTGDHRGHSLYCSADDGFTWQPVPQPVYIPVEGSRLHGLVAQRCCADDCYVYVTFSANGPRSQNVERGYTCDSGDCSCGRMARYARTPDGLGPMEDVTPEKGNWGFSAASAEHGMLVTATIHRQHQDGDAIYLSRDCGSTWTTILHGLHTGKIDFRLSYMKPEYNGGRSLIHWMTGLVIDPHRLDTAWFNTGTGVFRTDSLSQRASSQPAPSGDSLSQRASSLPAPSGRELLGESQAGPDSIVWQDWCDGMEETVHINCHAPASGRVQVLDMVGDLGGFAFTDVDRHCRNSFANAQGDRWITCLSCDWPDADPDHIVVAARGNWTGETKGGLIVSRDGAQSWSRLEMPMGLSQELDALLSKISGVNINAGWVAVSADGGTYVWAVAERIFLHARNLIVSHDAGQTFGRSRVFRADGSVFDGMLKPIADRCDARVFYGFGDAGELFVSLDGGDTFHEQPTPGGWPRVHFGKVDCADTTEIRAAAGEPGMLYIATGEGLWRLCYDRGEDGFTGVRLTAPEDCACCVGLGLGRPGGDYANEPKLLYFNGRIGGAYGFYRMRDDGTELVRLNTEKQMFGRIHSIDGDKRVFGRFYLATGSTGLLRGDMVEA